MTNSGQMVDRWAEKCSIWCEGRRTGTYLEMAMVTCLDTHDPRTADSRVGWDCSSAKGRVGLWDHENMSVTMLTSLDSRVVLTFIPYQET